MKYNLHQYADSAIFFDELLNCLSSFETSQVLEDLRDSLLDVLEAQQQSIIAYVSGPSCSRARGCSLYYPYAHIDASYISLFSPLKSVWLSFLYEFIGLPLAQVTYKR